jgi:hypothetical protein
MKTFKLALAAGLAGATDGNAPDAGQPAGGGESI